MRKMRFLTVCALLCALAGGALGAEALVYSDAEMGMALTIGQPSWTFYADRGAGQVYFFNGSKRNSESLISITAQALAGDAEARMDLLWQSVRNSLAGMEVSYGAMQTLRVGEDGQARLYPYALTKDGQKFQSYCAFWQANGRLYLCTASADSGTAEEVWAALEDLLASFQALP